MKSSHPLAPASVLCSVACLARGVASAAAQSAYERYEFLSPLGTLNSQGAEDGRGSAARFTNPFGIAVTNAKVGWIADADNNTIRMVDPLGLVSTFAGAARVAGSADGDRTEARFNRPRDVEFDSAGNLYVADTFNHTIRKITSSGAVSTLAGLAPVTGGQDGVGSAARFRGPSALAVDGARNVYVADTGNHVIRKITPDGVVSTLAGLAQTSGSADGRGPDARFNTPRGVAVDRNGNVFVGDRSNHTIRKIAPDGFVSTVAGVAGAAGSADGTGRDARFNNPTQIDVDDVGNLVVSDSFNHVIRKITPGGVVTTLAGRAGSAGFSNGIGSEARFDGPGGISVISNGEIFVVDTNNQIIRNSGTTAEAQPVNIATRLRVQPGERALIGGFIITGSAPKRVIVRAIGPSLQSSGVGGFLPDPQLDLIDSAGNPIAGNDNWRQAANAEEIRSTGVAPSHDLEAAIVVTLQAGQGYTAVVRGKGDAAGVAVVEAYDLDPAADALLANISTRGPVETGEDVMIGGFILGGGAGHSNIVVRALGPSLKRGGVAGALEDPVLLVVDANGDAVAESDDWKDSENAQQIVNAGLQPTDDLESAVNVVLRAGNYTALVGGYDDGTGIGLVEVYNLPYF